MGAQGNKITFYFAALRVGVKLMHTSLEAEAPSAPQHLNNSTHEQERKPTILLVHWVILLGRFLNPFFLVEHNSRA